jgi:Protein of unknown function (DUF2510)
MEGTATPPPAGWYEDPDDAALQRFWDGSRWTNSRMPRGEGVPLEGEELPPAPPSAFRYASDALDVPEAPPDGATGLPPAAWYADPENPTGMRYWDGAKWTEHRTDYRAAPPPKPVGEGMVAAGYILGFLFPIVGIVIGVIVMNRGNKHGRWILGMSLFFIAVFLVVGSLGDPSST